MPVVDMHAHIYPDKIAQRATESVGLFYDIPMSAHEGSVACLMELCADSDIAQTVVCSVAVKPQTVAPSTTSSRDRAALGLASAVSPPCIRTSRIRKPSSIVPAGWGFSA